MARIKYASIVSDVSGSVGSATFQRSLYGPILRNRPRNTRAGTASQLKARSVMMQCQYAWRALSVAQRKQWDQYIAFSGASINRDRGILMSGHSLYLKYNFHRLLRGLSVVNNLIYISAPQWPVIDYLQTSPTYVYIRFTGNLTTLNIWPTLLLSPKRVASWSFSKQGLRFMLDTYASTYYLGYTNVYNQIFGRPIAYADIIHYQLQWWSRTAPILSAIQTGILSAQPYF